MENVLDLKMPGVQELEQDELREVNGGNPMIALGGIATVIGIAVGWKVLCDEVNKIGQEIGAALVK